LDKEPPKKDTKDEKKDEKKDKKDEKKDQKDDKGAKKEEAKGKDGEKKEEKKEDEGPRIKADAKPALTLTFGRKDDKKDDLVYVRRETADGPGSRVAVPASALDKILPPEGALAYLDPNLAPYLVSDVAKLELKLPGGRTFVAVRQEEKDKDKKDKDKQ